MLKCVYKPCESCGGNLDCSAECFNKGDLKAYILNEKHDSETIEMANKIRDEFIKDYYTTIDKLE